MSHPRKPDELGTLVATDSRKVNLLLSRTKRVGPCLEWQGRRTERGYGLSSYGWRTQTTAHRIMAMAVWGREKVKEKQVCHSCDNPPCINPAHLFIGTQKENMQDCLKKGRYSRIWQGTQKQQESVRKMVRLSKLNIGNRQGEKSFWAKLNKTKVQAIRADTRRQPTIAAEYGITQSLVSQIKRRVIWKHL